MDRRSLLKSISISATGLPIIQKDTKKGRYHPKIIKGSPSNPVRKGQISRVRRTVFEALAEDVESPSEIAITGNPEPANGQLIGYGIAIQNGAPIEKIKTVSESSQITRKQHNKQVARGDSLPEQATTSVQDRVEAAHEDLNRFRRRFEGGER